MNVFSVVKRYFWSCEFIRVIQASPKKLYSRLHCFKQCVTFDRKWSLKSEQQIYLQDEKQKKQKNYEKKLVEMRGLHSYNFTT